MAYGRRHRRSRNAASLLLILLVAVLASFAAYFWGVSVSAQSAGGDDGYGYYDGYEDIGED